MHNVGLDEVQAGIKIARRNISNLRYADDTTLTAEGEEASDEKEPLDEGERGEWKSWLKTQHSKKKDNCIQSHYFMENRGETMETVREFIFLLGEVLQITQMVTAVMKLKDACSLEEKL